MKRFRADMHIHTVLSPCADLEMSPANIISGARSKKMDIIGITDHNHTGQCKLVQQLCAGTDLFVLSGTEVTTREEIHCLAFFEDSDSLQSFQEWVDCSILKIKNKDHLFGYQLILDKDENILEEVDHYLGTALDKSIEEVENRVHELAGIFIPAHIDRTKNSIYSQLGFIPEEIGYDALEISWRVGRESFINQHPELANARLVTNSDSHFVADIGRRSTLFEMESASFSELRLALKGSEGRKIIWA
jgi:3',5'-nucleoside bisphosphate phosphatase